MLIYGAPDFLGHLFGRMMLPGRGGKMVAGREGKEAEAGNPEGWGAQRKAEVGASWVRESSWD